MINQDGSSIGIGVNYGSINVNKLSSKSFTVKDTTNKTNTKTIYYHYRRDFKPHSEFAVRQQCIDFIISGNTNLTMKIYSSTASLFNMLRAFCYRHKLILKAKYNDKELLLTSNMRMNDWSQVEDFNELDEDMAVLLNSY